VTQEALKLALEALEDVGVLTNREWQAVHKNKANELRQAIAELESQEPFGYFKAEPFGWTDCAETDEGAIALYQSPLQRTWIGLTDDEFNDLYERYVPLTCYGLLIEKVEAKLKQKNGYAEEKNS
jgi:hypothetical protein